MASMVHFTQILLAMESRQICPRGELPHEDFRKVRKRLEEKFQLPGEV